MTTWSCPACVARIEAEGLPAEGNGVGGGRKVQPPHPPPDPGGRSRTPGKLATVFGGIVTTWSCPACEATIGITAAVEVGHSCADPRAPWTAWTSVDLMENVDGRRTHG